MATIENRRAGRWRGAPRSLSSHEIVERQRAAFLADPFPSLQGAPGAARRARRDARRPPHRDPTGAEQRLRRAPGAGRRSDRGARPGGAGRVRGRAARRLDGARARASDPALYGSGRAFVQPQPKGVVGNIVPWNFPFDLSVGPLWRCSRPATASSSSRRSTRPPAPSCCARWSARRSIATAWTSSSAAWSSRAPSRDVRWDHLLYTGSPAVGREIAKAAAEQLVPVTLELGGKCPAILADDSVDAESVKQVLATKAIKNGQMCISVDYCLVPREQLEEFAALAADSRARCDARLLPVGRAAPASSRPAISSASRRCSRMPRARSCDVRAAGGDRRGRPGTRQLPHLARHRPARRSRADARGDVRADPAGQGLRHARRGDRLRQRRRAPAGALRVRQGRGNRL